MMNVVGALLSPIVAKSLGKKKVAIITVVITSITSVGMFFTGYNSLSFIFFWNIIGAVAMGASNIVTTSMVADCVEYGQWKTGNRAEGMVFSTNIFKTKLASAVGGAAGAYALHVSGYIPNVVQSKQTLDTIHLFFTLLPGILAMAALFPLFKYNLTERQYNEILSNISS